MRLGLFAIAMSMSMAFAGCGDNLEGDDLQGGDATIDDRTGDAFTHPVPTLTDEQKFTWQLGRGPFNFTWAPPQLGRLFNHSACLACHGGNGRGLSSVERGPFGSQALVRVSLPNGTPSVPGGNVPVPGFGEQLQDHSTSGLPEVFLAVTWSESFVYYGDNTPQSMRLPTVDITLPSSDPPPAMLTSYRQAPPLQGLGLLEAVPDETLAELEDPDDADGDGISGRRNIIFDSATQTMRTGRFGHKASAISLHDQTAGAFLNDMGLTSKVFPEADGQRNVNDDQLDQVIFFVSTIAVPRAAVRNAAAQRGRVLFREYNCAGCHTPTLETGEHEIPQLANQVIHPYTDMLLHDVGDLLTDARSDHQATGVEWRTPPLWGIGLAQLVLSGATFLHDGRARTLAEAILWHGGEAEAARESFRMASKADRDALIAFLETL